jgi:predicted enzyme related to lactoylglutathione lyase
MAYGTCKCCSMLRAGDAKLPRERKGTMDYRLELVPIPVSDVDRAKTFYAEKVGFTVDHDVNASTDHRVSDQRRIVQLTPPGSACSIAFGIGILDTQPGSVRALHLVVSDIEAARGELIERGVEVGEVQDLGGVLYAHFSDPDGNGWALQQLPY